MNTKAVIGVVCLVAGFGLSQLCLSTETERAHTATQVAVARALAAESSAQKTIEAAKDAAQRELDRALFSMQPQVSAGSGGDFGPEVSVLFDAKAGEQRFIWVPIRKGVGLFYARVFCRPDGGCQIAVIDHGKFGKLPLVGVSEAVAPSGK